MRDDKEMNILKIAIDECNYVKQKEKRNMPGLDEMIRIVEHYLKKNDLLCYGGTAINNLLPKSEQFYDLNVEIPDYDFYSSNAIEHTKRLTDIYSKHGYYAEAKPGVHHGTYKVFVNYIPMADITQMDKIMFDNLFDSSIEINEIRYVPPNFLRASMYLELSRPKGDVDRWEKVMKRLRLLNKYHPINKKGCQNKNIQRKLIKKNIDSKKLFTVSKNYLVERGVIFFGGYANIQYLSKYSKKNVNKDIPDFDVISEKAEHDAKLFVNELRFSGFTSARYKRMSNVDETIPNHYQIEVIPNEIIAHIYESVACHSYNILPGSESKPIKIATIDTMLSYYLYFLYTDKGYYDENRILCMIQYLFEVQEKYKYKQEGILKRFNTKCDGYQKQKEDFMNEKSEKYEELKNKKNSKEYNEWFFTYRPKTKKNGDKSKKRSITMKKRSIKKRKRT